MISAGLWHRGLLGVFAILLGGCETLAYYSQAVAGQWSLQSHSQSIDQLINSDVTEPQLKRKLQQIQAIRQFASSELGLPDNNSYRYYADIKRPYVVWNVFAAEEFSVLPKQWCFAFAGCVSYRGYFSQQSARHYAAGLAAQGYDTYVAGVTAYSTLGWFNDPVLNTFIDQDESSLARLIFHELAHQQFYLAGDTRFNESFAQAVAIAGVNRWLRSQDALVPVMTEVNVQLSPQPGSLLNSYLQRQSIEKDFVATVLSFRDRLAVLYQQDVSVEQKRKTKRQLIENFIRLDYAQFKDRWPGNTDYDEWVKQSFNNAKLATVVSYYQWLPAFQQLLAEQHGDLQQFYRQVERLAKLKADERELNLQRLAARSAGN